MPSLGTSNTPRVSATFSYVNPVAPKGGDIAMVSPSRASSFDKYNPFTLKGTAPPGLGSLMLETLLTGNSDEPTTAYGLLAEDVSVAKDKLSVIFRLNPLARFHNGDPVLAMDVKYSYDRLTSKEAAPQFRTYFSEIASVVVLSEREIRFDFKRANAELPLIVGGMSVFSHQWGADKPFDKVITEVPIGSGPYKLGQVDFGKDIQYVRDTNYWAKNLNVRKGMFNFDRISYRLYKDTTAQFEGFKAGEFDYIQAFVAREWAQRLQGQAV
jgi:microcin C transport system substrate-binding protein